MRKILTAISGAVVLVAAASSSPASAAAQSGSATFRLESTIAFTSTRDNPAFGLLGAEIYLMNADGTNPRRLTDNDKGDAFPVLSPDGKKIVFDSNRLTAGTVCDGVVYDNIDDLFLMDNDGSEQTLLSRGSSATWSPDSKNIAFHSSASYYVSGGLVSGCPIRTDPGSATSDSDIFVVSVDDLLAGVEQPTNITNSPDMIDDDADWSPDGQKIVFTSHPVTDNKQRSNQAELYLMNPDGRGLQRLTYNNEEERAPAWSPDSSRIVYSCRVGGGTNPFRICVMRADGSDIQQLTNENDLISDLTATWSPEGDRILYHRRGVVAPDNPTLDGQQLFTMQADGTEQAQLTYPPGINNLANWGELRVKD